MRGESSVTQTNIVKFVPFQMYGTVDQLYALGISRSTINRKLKRGEWKLYENDSVKERGGNRKILISSLPSEVQLIWARLNLFRNETEQTELSLSNEPDPTYNEHEKEIRKALLRLPPDDRIFWISEALRLSQIVMRYGEIKPKRRRDLHTGELEFVPLVYQLCKEAICTVQKILFREPHRQFEPSPFTLDGWWRAYQEIGLLTFFRKLKSQTSDKIDKRCAVISLDAAEWLNSNWKHFQSPEYLYRELEDKAKLNNWRIPSKSWVYRQWKDIPEVVRVFYLEGRKAYESKLAPYVPRDYSDLTALQVLCGDHSERDVTVLLLDRTLARPWLTIWYDLRIGLIWGWFLSLVPSSHTAGLAYANGVQNFGAQPFSRPDDRFYSYIYTDRGRDYRSHNWDGKVITIHRNAMRPDGGFEAILVQNRVGIIDELDIKHLLTRGRNPKENPVERLHKIISEWEQNTFDEYCGRNAASRPEQWHKLYAQHQLFERGKRDTSPFMSFDEYREALAEFIARYNSLPHKRTTLGGKKLIPIEEYHRLYTTRYEIAPATLALLLMKVEKRKIGKIGVTCFQDDWFYNHEAMSMYKGKDVEVRYSDDNYNRVWVVLPNLSICEATRIPRSSVINPNRETIIAIKKARSEERTLIENFQLFTQSTLRGETTEDRVARQIEAGEFDTEENPGGRAVRSPSSVHRLTRFDKSKLEAVKSQKHITAEDIKYAEADDSIFIEPSSLSHIDELENDD